jgi:hypothetical protein
VYVHTIGARRGWAFQGRSLGDECRRHRHLPADVFKRPDITADPAWKADGTELAVHGNLGSAQYLPDEMSILEIEPANAVVNAASYQSLA